MYLLGEKSQQTRAAVCGDGAMVAKRNEERKERREGFWTLGGSYRSEKTDGGLAF